VGRDLRLPRAAATKVVSKSMEFRPTGYAGGPSGQPFATSTEIMDPPWTASKVVNPT